MKAAPHPKPVTNKREKINNKPEYKNPFTTFKLPMIITAIPKRTRKEKKHQIPNEQYSSKLLKKTRDPQVAPKETSLSR